jgi:putative Holliday junction resolvase
MSEQFRKYLGVDWGEQRIGVAISDSETKMAVPWGTVSSLEELLGAVETEDADLVVVGVPVKMSGSKDSLPPEFTKFLSDLKQRCGLPLKFVDERLTSREADSLAGGAHIDRDAVAAMLILQTYIDRNL